MSTRSESVWASASPAPAVLRAGAILDALARSRGRALTPAQLAAAAGDIPRASVVNVCAALHDRDLVRAVDGGFVLGPGLLRLSQAYLDALDPVRAFKEQMGRLGDREETLQLATMEGADVVYLAVHEGTVLLRPTSKAGSRLPVTCTALGKAMLAGVPEDDVRALLADGEPFAARTSWSITALDPLLADLRAVRTAGHAVDDQEAAEGIVCVAATVPGSATDGQPFAVSSSLLKSQATPDRVAAVADLIKDVVRGMAEGN
ncbi:IclR family transcriptional regulator [Prauserella cavernicola]|uniref:IclR family transcriptional regulator n=1 Tax=Prauserella cavernicola TaxID=2800127 RepID=A0A934QNN0_9PSEU|nr:IclR family transcriptional regulator [Prauserella cavernicola]MBK1783830.1 IclR family transcriptional regulator [Prauserella cavernicola]